MGLFFIVGVLTIVRRQSLFSHLSMVVIFQGTIQYICTVPLDGDR